MSAPLFRFLLLACGASAIHVADDAIETDKTSQTMNDTTQLMMCNHVCVRCGDGTQMVIMRDMDGYQFGRMLATQGVILAATTLANVVVPGAGGVAGYLANAAANKVVDKGIELAVDGLSQWSQGPNKCNNIAILSTRDLPELNNYGQTAGKWSNGRFGQSFKPFLSKKGKHLRTIDHPGQGQRKWSPEYFDKIDIWRKDMDPMMDEERKQSGMSWVERQAKAAHEWISDGTGWIDTPDALQDLLIEDPLYCGLHGGSDAQMILDNPTMLGIKSHIDEALATFETDVLETSAAACEELYRKEDGRPPKPYSGPEAIFGSGY